MPFLEVFKISKSTYHDKNNSVRNSERDPEAVAIIEAICERHRYKIGIRQIKLELEYKDNLVMNRKKIERIKKVYEIPTLIRKKSGHRKVKLEEKEHSTYPNILQREFNVDKPDTVYSIDVTQINYLNGKAYLAAMKDLCTKDIVAYSLSFRNDLGLTSKALNRALAGLTNEQKKQLMIHSDQGFNFTHKAYSGILSENGITQSMSRRGNCLDNAPIESFFGYLKDHISPKSCNTVKKLEVEIERVIKYYNDERPQIGTKKMPPTVYRRLLKS